MWLLRGQDSPAAEQNDGERRSSEGQTILEMKEQFEQQQQLIHQLKEMLRENEQQAKKKEQELEESASKLSKLRLQHKAKVTDLTNQLKESKMNKTSSDNQQVVNSEVISESTTAGQNRGKIILLKKQLDENRAMFEKREKEMSENKQSIEQQVEHLRSQLEERDRVISELKKTHDDVSNGDDSKSNNVSKPNTNSSSSDEIGFRELYAQMVYKDAKVLELDNRILELERNIMDLQENLKEKDEIISARNQAIHLMSADLSRKGKVVVDQLDDTRDQMKLMQQNFAAIESEWKTEKLQLTDELENLKTQQQRSLVDSDHRIKQMEEALTKLETTRFDLSSRNAQLQEKVVLMQEKLETAKSVQNSNHEAKCKELQEEIDRLKDDLAKKEIPEQSNVKTKGSEQKWLKLKAQLTRQIRDLEAQVTELQNNNEASEKIGGLQQQIGLLEEEKKELKLRLIDYVETLNDQDRLKRLIDDLNIKIRQQNDDLDQHLKMVSVLQSAKLDLADQLVKQRISLEEAENQKQTLSTELQLLKNEHTDLQNRLLQLEEQNTNVDARLQEALDNFENLNLKNEKEKMQISADWETKSSMWRQTEAEMNEQIVELQSELQQMKASKDEINVAIVEKDEDLKKLNEEFYELRMFVEEKGKEWKSEKDHLNSFIQQLESSRERYEKTMHSDSKQMQQLHLDILEKSQANDALKEQLSVSENEVERWRNCTSECNTQLANAHKKQEVMEAELEQLKKAAGETEEDFERIITERDQMLEDLKCDLRRINEESLTKEELWQDQIAALKEDLNHAKAEFNACQDILTEKDDRLRELFSQMSTLEISTNQKEDDLQLSQVSIDQLREAISVLQLNLETKTEESNIMHKKYEKLQQQFKELDETRQRQELELQSLQGNLQEALQNVEKYSQMKAKLENDIEQLKCSYSGQGKTLEIQINELTVQCDALAEREIEMKTELQRLETEVHSLTASNKQLEELRKDGESKYAELQLKQEATDQIKEDLTIELSKCHLVVQNLQEELTNYMSVSNVLCDTQKQLETALIEKQELLNLNSELVNQLDAVKERTSDLLKSSEMMQDELNTYSGVSDSLSATEKRLASVLSENQELHLLTSSLKEEVNDMSKLAEELKATKSELKIYSGVSDLLYATKQKLEAAGNEWQELSTVNSSLAEDDNDAYDLNKSDLVVQRLQVELRNYVEVSAKLFQTRNQLDIALNEKQELITQNSNLTDQLNDAEGKINELTGAHLVVEKRLQEEVKTYSEISDSLCATQKQLETVSNENRELHVLNTTLTDQLSNLSNMAEELKSSKSVVEQLQEELKMYSGVSDSFCDTKRQLEVALNDNQDLLATISDLNSSLDRYGETTNELEEANCAVKQLQEELKNHQEVSDLLNDARTQLEVAVNEKQDLELVISDLNNKLGHLETAENEMLVSKSDVVRLQEQLDDSQKRLEFILNEKQELLALNAELNNKLYSAGEMANELNKLSVVVERLQEEQRAAAKEKRDLLTLNSGLKDELDDAREMVDRLSSDAEVNSEKYAEVLKAVDDYTNEIARLDLELQYRQNVIVTQEKDMGDLTNQIGSLEMANRTLHEAKHGAEVEIENLRRAVERLQFFETEFQRCSENVGTLESELKLLRLEEVKIKEQNSRLLDYTQQLESDLASISESCRTLEDEKEELGKRLHDLVKEKEEIFVSNSDLQERYATLQKKLEDDTGAFEVYANNLKLELSSLLETHEIVSKNEHKLQLTCANYEEECQKLQSQLQEVIEQKTNLEKSADDLKNKANLSHRDFTNVINGLEEGRLILEKRVSESEARLASEREAFELQSRHLNEEIEILRGSSTDEVRLLTEKLGETLRDAEAQRMADSEKLITKESQAELQETVIQQLTERLRANNIHLASLRTCVVNLINDLQDNSVNVETDSDDNAVDVAISLMEKLSIRYKELVSATEELKLKLEAEIEQSDIIKAELAEMKSKFLESDSQNEIVSEEVKMLQQRILEFSEMIEDSNARLSASEEDSSNQKLVIEQLNLRLEERKEQVMALQQYAEEVEQMQLKLSSCLGDEESSSSTISSFNKFMEMNRLSAEASREEINGLQRTLAERETEWNSKLVINEETRASLVEELETMKRQRDIEQRDLCQQTDVDILQRNISDHRSEIEQLQLHIGSITQHLNVANDELSNQRQENQVLLDQLNEAKLSNDEFDKLKLILQEISDGNDQTRSLDEFDHDNPTFSSLFKLIEDFNSSKVVLAEQNAQLESCKFELNDFKQMCSDLEEKLEKFEEDRQRLLDEVRNSKNSLENAQVMSMEHNNHFEEVMKEFQRHVGDYEEKIERLGNDKAALIEKHRRECQELSSHIEQKSNSVLKLESDCRELFNQLELSREQLHKLSNENTRIKQELVNASVVRANSSVVEERLQSSSSSINVESDTSDRPDSPQEMKKAMAVLKIKNEKMMAKLKMFKDKNDKLQIQINELITERSRLEDQNVRMTDHQQRAKDEIHRLSVELRNIDRLWKTDTQQLQDRLHTVEMANDKLVDIKEDLEKRLMLEIKLRKDLAQEKDNLEKLNAQSNAECVGHVNKVQEELEYKCEQLERKLNSELDHNKFLESDLRQYQDLNEKLQKEKQKTEVEIQTQVELYQSIVSECNMLKEELERLKADHEESLSKLNREFELQLKNVESHRGDIQQRLMVAIEAKDILERRLDGVQDVLLSIGEVLPNINDGREEEFTDITWTLKSFIDRANATSIEYEKLKSEMLTVLAKAEETEISAGRLSALGEEIMRLETESAYYREENSKISDQLNQFVDQNQQLMSNLSDLEMSLVDVGRQKENLHTELNGIIQQQSDTIRNLQNQSSINSSRDGERYAELQSELELLRSSFDNVRLSRDNILNEVEVLRNENSLLKSEIDSWKTSRANQYIQQETVQRSGDVASFPVQSNDDRLISQLEAELQQAISSVHARDLRCEELTDEITQFIEERDSLQIRLSSLLRADQQKEVRIQMLERELHSRSHNANQPSIRNTEDMDETNSDFGNLSLRLTTCEQQRQELQDVNAVLNETLVSEREARMKLAADLKFAEAELESRWRYKPKLKKETKLQMSDIETPLLAESPQIIERTYTGTTWRIINWIQGRRRFLLRSYRTKHPLQLIWYVYIFVLHVAFLLIAM